MRVPKEFFPILVGVSVYLLVNWLFPNKNKELEDTQINPQEDIKDIEDIRGGDVGGNNFFNNLFKITIKASKYLIDKLKTDRGLKLGLLSLFFTAGYQHFNKEIEELLVEDVYGKICDEQVKGKLKIVCDIIKEHELNLHTKTMKELIVSSSISKDEKVNLLKIKLDFIINGESPGKKKFLLAVIISLLMSIFMSGVAGLGIFLEALFRLFQEGKISEALYKQLLEFLEIIKENANKVPVEQAISLFKLFKFF